MRDKLKSCYGRDYTLIHNSKENQNIIVQRFQGYLKKTKMPTKQFTQTFSNKSENIYAKTFYKIFASFGG